jgi:hypothetical protein
MPQDATAHALYERTVPLHQHCKGQLRRGVVSRHESLEKFSIRQPTDRAGVKQDAE